MSETPETAKMPDELADTRHHTDACVHPDQHAAVIREWGDAKAEVERLGQDRRLIHESAQIATRNWLDALEHCRVSLARAEIAEAAIERGLALCEEYATHHPDWRPLATQTAIVFRRALTGEGDKRWLEELAAAGLRAAALDRPTDATGETR